MLVRPSYVLGGRGMEIVYDEQTLAGYIARATTISPERPVLVDRFLDDAIEIDVDALCDGDEVFIGGVMEHIEEAGVHSGDSSCALPPITLGRGVLDEVRRCTDGHRARGRRARAAQRAVRAARRDALRAGGQPAGLAHGAVRVQGHRGAAGQGGGPDHARRHHRASCAPRACCRPRATAASCRPDAPIAVKEAVLPFHRFRTREGHGVDPLLGPEMKSTGEVMGFDASFGAAFAKSQAAAYGSLPTVGRVFVSIADRDKRAMVFPVLRLAALGFEVLATGGTADVLRRHGMATTVVRKHFEGGETIVDRILAGDVDMIINTPYGNSGPRIDGYEIRSAAVARACRASPPMQGAAAAVQGIEAMKAGRIGRALAAGRARRAAQGPRSVECRARQAAVRRGFGVTGCSRPRWTPTARSASGIDPHPGLLAEWGLTDDPDGLERFATTCVQALAGQVAVVKPQSAFFERHGARGIAVLERVLAALADTPTLSLLDVKRGDIGSTMDGYADAYLGVGAPLAADAVTLSPYLGFGSLDAAIRTASDAGRGVFVLARTSNPEGGQVQLAEWAGRSTAQVDRRRGRGAQRRRRRRSVTSAWSSAPPPTTSWT